MIVKETKNGLQNPKLEKVRYKLLLNKSVFKRYSMRSSPVDTQ